MPAHTTLLKATSYMTHHDEFSTIRDMVMDHSAAVFQDDSGVPYHFFTADKWNVQLYGEYTKPYGSFSWLEQPDLRKAYLGGGSSLSAAAGLFSERSLRICLLAKRVSGQNQ
jgi:hypothetical protein